MNERDIKLSMSAHALAGYIAGLAEGVGYWRVGDIDEETLGRLRSSLETVAQMASKLATDLSEKDNGTQG